MRKTFLFPSISLKLIISDIRFWIFLFFILRLYGITNPPLEVAHNWRQTTVTMVTRNFLEVNSNILYPRIDIAGEKTGITGMEFPFLNYLIYLVSKIFGYAHWYGRLINLIVSSIGIFYFYKLIRKYFNAKIAFNSAIVLLFSIWFAYSRKIMPDTFAMSFTILGLYYGCNYLEKRNKLKDLMFYFLFTGIGILSKLPSAYILVIFIFLLFEKNKDKYRKIIFIISTLIIMIIVSYYYFYWVPYLVKEYGFWHFFMGKNILHGMNEISANIPETLKRFYDDSLKYVGFILFLLGLFQAIRKNDKLLIGIFLLSLFSFIIIVLKSGNTFAKHSYYIIPFTPVMALVCGYGINFFKSNKIMIIAMVLVGIEGILNQQHDFIIKNDNKKILNLEKDMDKVSNKNDLILINSGYYPTPMYFAHRKGWVDFNDKIADSVFIDSLRIKGLKNIVILKKTFGTDLKLGYEIVLQNENYTIYGL